VLGTARERGVAENAQRNSLPCGEEAIGNELKQSVTKRKTAVKPGVRPCGSSFARVE